MSAEPVLPPAAVAPVEEWTPQDWVLAKLGYLSRHRPLTVADLHGVDPSVGRLELLDGVLLVTPHADVDHTRRARRLANQLDGLVPPGCEALDGVNVFEPGTDRVCVIPDVAVIRTDRIVQVPGQGEGVFPDGLELIIEITSSNREVDLGVKKQRYESWGVPYLAVDRSTDPYSYLTFGDWPEWAGPLLPSGRD
ncbi:Uma2 family endonuclease [Kineosporia babensis]|uniref:Uma2 family endonuclease n=1 Tax=Kineosporia babensis TaxID=499548 RepID=A0A9X1NG89_9ACTN|nr:Uma2 family endonuclease [Kineosporia babensis]MCD5313475.1 Uma2 family endonuclease [Kineosporia babensis]